jgi:hypothetical protein
MVASTIFYYGILAARTGALVRVLLHVGLASELFFSEWARLTTQACIVLFARLAVVEGGVVGGAVAMSAVCVAACEDVAVVLVVNSAGVVSRCDAFTIASDLMCFFSRDESVVAIFVCVLPNV